MLYRDNRKYDVRAFTSGQLRGLRRRRFPAALSGPNYPRGIPIYDEETLPDLIRRYSADEVVLAYSDLTFQEVMEKASTVLRSGARFTLLDPRSTMLKSRKPVIAVCAVRTGAGKSSVTRRLCDILRGHAIDPVVIRHPMPYGDLKRQVCQRFVSLEDLDRQSCTIEEREEYEPLLRKGLIVYSGIGMREVLRRAERDGDMILFDGGNNDTPFISPDLYLTVADPFRPGQELTTYPGTLNVLMADVIVINKVNTAPRESVDTVRGNLRRLNEKATIIETASEVMVDHPELVKENRVLVVEDGPTVTHGGLSFGVGTIAARRFGAREIIDPRPYAVGTIKETYRDYAHLQKVLPTIGYNSKQIDDLEKTISATDCDTVILGTTIDLRRVVAIDKPVVRVDYDLREIGTPTLDQVLIEFEKRLT